MHVAPLGTSIHDQAVGHDVRGTPRLRGLARQHTLAVRGLLHLLQPVRGALEVIRAHANLNHGVVQMREVCSPRLCRSLQPHLGLLMRRRLVPGADEAHEGLRRIVTASIRRPLQPILHLVGVAGGEAPVEQTMVAIRVRLRALGDRGGERLLRALAAVLGAAAGHRLGDEGVHHRMDRAPGGTDSRAQSLLHPIASAVDVAGVEASLDEHVHPCGGLHALGLRLASGEVRPALQQLAELPLRLGHLPGAARLDNGLNVSELEVAHLRGRLLLGWREVVELHETPCPTARESDLPRSSLRIATGIRERVHVLLVLPRCRLLHFPPGDKHQPRNEGAEGAPLRQGAVTVAFGHTKDELVEQPKHDRGNTCDH
mmetsp:Transcript_84779/g.237402  ORF Transcript_84779/g.237402 Transcript_84779/m.237402 type:complete len:371 (-) Transcript_84779:162-1274(-)